MHKQFNPHSQCMRCKPIGDRVDDIEAIIATKDEICTICSFPLGSEAVRIKLNACGHEFHTYCLQNWYLGKNKDTCPNCRNTFSESDKKYMKEQLVNLLNAKMILGGAGQEKIKKLEETIDKLKASRLNQYDLTRQREAEFLLKIGALEEDVKDLYNAFKEEHALANKFQKFFKKLEEDITNFKKL